MKAVVINCSTTSKNKKTSTQRLEMRKFCPKCGRHTLHRETK
nr:50S ribosomal protein L33 [uncultured Dubosiella sp.]